MGRRLTLDIVECSNCMSGLSLHDETLICANCGTVASYRDGRILFFDLPAEQPKDPLYWIKSKLKPHHRLYSLMIRLVSPICPNSALKKFINRYIELNEGTFINFGSGNSDLSCKISNVDLIAYPQVDMTCDLSNLPFKNDSIDCIINVAVLEHVQNPEKVVSEFHRTLKCGGRVFINLPFIQGFHSSPHDYSRRTLPGLVHLLKDFKIEECGVVGGPTSALIWILQEWIAILLSFGSKKLHSVVYVLLLPLLFPLKYLDKLLIKHPLSQNISSNFYAVACKE